MKEYDMIDRLGVFMADNALNCDKACELLVSELCPNESPTARRARCFGHIVNLAAKAFIFGAEDEGFVITAEQLETATLRDYEAAQREMALWRKKGAFGKFHNIVKFIRASPQRRQRFQSAVAMVLSNREQGVVEGGVPISGSSSKSDQ